MTDVLPVVLVGTDKHLAVELIGGHGERRHVRRKLKERRKAVHTHKTQTGGERSDLSLSFVNMGLDEKILVISGSRSTTVMLSTSGYFRISRTARPSPPPRIRTRRGAGTAARPGWTSASW